MIDCPSCGTTNTSDSRYCRYCGQALDWASGAESEHRSTALPPIPDGGLAQSMPGWLRAPLAAPAATPGTAPEMPAPATETERIDPRTFLTEADLPPWLRQLATARDQPAPSQSPAMPWDQPWTAISPPAPATSTTQPTPVVEVLHPPAPTVNDLPPMPTMRQVVEEQRTPAIEASPARQLAWPHLLLLIVVVLIVLAIGVAVILASAGRF